MIRAALAAVFVLLPMTLFAADSFQLHLRSQKPSGKGDFERSVQRAEWKPAETAIIVCDVWDYHHCLNAVRRLEEFGPRMNEVLQAARKQGATIIHSPSDCMPAYADHPARRRAISAPIDEKPPADIAHWCSQIKAEKDAPYPIDQSDGGEDDDPKEHAAWAEKLKSLGRNPNMPWKKQSPMIEIDGEKDYISDRGNEVWNILTAKGIRHVILVGVHTNMCVLGRPFGLRQMVKHGREVVLMRDMTDCMYNPARWPYVDHYTGNDLIISHVERHVCPTITSDQILGGETFSFKNDEREKREVMAVGQASAEPSSKHWSIVSLPTRSEASGGNEVDGVWYRCAVKIPASWTQAEMQLRFEEPHPPASAWLNGKLLNEPKSVPKGRKVWVIDAKEVTPDEANLVVIHLKQSRSERAKTPAPVLVSGDKKLSLAGGWQMRIGDDASWSNIPLPAKFGAGADWYHEPQTRP